MSQLDPRDDEKTAGDNPLPEAKEEGVMEYPSMHKRILIMTALLLCLFLVALVTIFLYLSMRAGRLTTDVGPKHYIDRNPSNN